jgi:hypothetical protein
MTKLTKEEKEKLRDAALAEFNRITYPAYVKYTKLEKSIKAEYLKIYIPATDAYWKRCKEIDEM